jgi:hypothetical protein
MKIGKVEGKGCGAVGSVRGFVGRCLHGDGVRIQAVRHKGHLVKIGLIFEQENRGA